jgi:hypothetical protein
MVYSMIALVVVMNVFLTVVMDAFADAKNVEDKKVQVMNARTNSKHVVQRLATERLKFAYKQTMQELKTLKKRNEKESKKKVTAVVPVVAQHEDGEMEESKTETIQ